MGLKIDLSVRKKAKHVLLNVPLVHLMHTFTKAILMNSRKAHKSNSDYWENRYAHHGNSGAGSFGKLQKFKAEVLNPFVINNQISSVIEFGCGDGNQLSSFNFPTYIGLDISRIAVRLCISKFRSDTNKSFFLYDPDCFEDKHSLFKADLALSLDVVYHIVEDEIFEKYMRHLFSSSNRFVIIYSTDFDSDKVAHIRHRLFSKWVKEKMPNWILVGRIKNKYPDQSKADFFIFKKMLSE